MKKKYIFIFGLVVLLLLSLAFALLWEKNGEEELLEEEKEMTEEEIKEHIKAAYYFDLETALATRETVYRLDLGRQDLENIPGEIEKLKDLRDLNLSNNNLEEVPAEIGSLTNLKRLNLSYNNLSYLPEEIKNLKNLEELDLTGNDFSKDYIKGLRKVFANTEIFFTEEE